jgi:putative transposase
MTTRKEQFVTGEYYHVYNRGNSRQNIFKDDIDRDRFVKLLYLCNSAKSIDFRDDIVKQKIDAFDYERGGRLVSIGAWVLMPNHFHLYITPYERVSGGDKEVSLFMNKLSTAYSMYFNKKHSRTGTLFEGPFKSVLLEEDEQAKYLFSYIHLNPVKLIDPQWKKRGLENCNKTLKFLEEYKWSSYHDYRGKKRPESKIIIKDEFPEYFSNPKIFDEEIFEWLDIKEKIDKVTL